MEQNYWDVTDVLSGLSHANLNANTDSEGTSQPHVRYVCRMVDVISADNLLC